MTRDVTPEGCQHRKKEDTAGQITFRWADREETYGEGDAYYARPGTSR